MNRCDVFRFIGQADTMEESGGQQVLNCLFRRHTKLLTWMQHELDAATTTIYRQQPWWSGPLCFSHNVGARYELRPLKYTAEPFPRSPTTLISYAAYNSHQPIQLKAHTSQYVHTHTPTSHTLSYLSKSPPTASLAIGSTTTIPPTPDTLTENPAFLRILHSVIRANATHDPECKAQAAMYASSAGSSLGSGGVFFPSNHPSQQHQRGTRQRGEKRPQQYGGGGGAGGDGAGGASAQGGMGGAGRGGYIHVSDQRLMPDFGRVAWPEDIFGSLEVDARGGFVGENGGYQESGTYRVVTREGM